jgi:HK97 family phage major capsid protein
MKIKEIKEKRAEIWEKMKALNDKSEDRSLTSEEQTEWNSWNTELDDLGAQVKRAEQVKEIERQQAEIAAEARSLNGKSIDQVLSEKSSKEEKRELAFSGWLRVKSGHDATDEQVQAAASLGVRCDSKEFDFELRRKVDEVFISRHTGVLRAFELRAQATTPGSAGGDLIPEGFQRELEKALLFFGNMLDIARILRTNEGNDIPWPTVDDTANAGSAVAENAAAGETDVVFGQIVLKAFKQTSDLVKVSMELMEDSFMDMGAILGELLGERMGRRLNTLTTVGAGTTEPTGIMVDSPVGFTTLGAAITGDDLIDFQTSVDPAYRNGAQWGFHDNTIASIRKLKTTDLQYIWQPGLIDGVPDRLLGSPVNVNNDIAEVASAALVGFYGQMQKFIIRQVRNVRVRRLDELYAENDQVGFVGWNRYDSRLIDAGTGPVKTLEMLT